jgi:hypothetical protein
MSKSDAKPTAPALAALSICEAVLLTLVEENVLGRDMVQEILEDAVETHLVHAPKGSDQEPHRKAARLIEEIIITLNAVSEGDSSERSRLAERLDAAAKRRGRGRRR